MLKAAGIPVYTPYHPDNLQLARPHVVVVGNAIVRTCSPPEDSKGRTSEIEAMPFSYRVTRSTSLGLAVPVAVTTTDVQKASDFDVLSLSETTG